MMPGPKPAREAAEKRSPAFLEVGAGLLLVVFPPAAAGALSLAGLGRRVALRPTSWVVIWCGYLLPIAVVALVTGRGLLMPALQAAFGIGLGLLVAVRRPRAVVLGVVVGLLAATTAGLLERELSRRMWWDASTPMGLTDLLTGVSQLSGDSPGWHRNGLRLFEKTWRLPAAAPADPLDRVLTFDLRGESRALGWQWYTNDPATTQELLSEEGQSFARIGELVAPIVRRVRTEAPLAGRTVRATVELRSDDPAELGDELGIAVRTFEPSAALRQPVDVDSSWQTFQVIFTFPAEARQPTFEVVIGTAPAGQLDVRNLRVEESLAGAWKDLGAAEPAGVNLRVPVPGVHVFSQPTLNVRPTSEWTSQSLLVPWELTAGVEHLGAHLQLESGTRVELRNVALGPAGGGRSLAVAEPKSRSSLLFEQANLAGHAYVAAGLLALLLALGGRRLSNPLATSEDIGWRPFAAALIIAVVMLAAVTTTGSRAAFFGGVAGAGILVGGAVLSRGPGSRRQLTALTVGLALAVTAVVAVGADGDLLGRLAFWEEGGSANQVSRGEVWQAAVAGIRQQPLSGWGETGFPDLWRSLHPSDGRAVPQHAHNFWLQSTVAFGLPGLLSALWLSGALLLVAFRTRGTAGLIVVGTLLAMQLVDNTLTHLGVLLPLVALLDVRPDRRGCASSRTWG